MSVDLILLFVGGAAVGWIVRDFMTETMEFKNYLTCIDHRLFGHTCTVKGCLATQVKREERDE